MTYLDRTTGGIDTTYLYHPQTDVAGGGAGDSNFRLKTIQHGAAGTGNAWPDFTYEYDKVGNITKMTTLSTAGTDTQTFGYDELNRLVSASASGVAPNGTITDYPFPGYEVENPTGTPTVRITFSIARQAVALKVMGASTAAYYLYNDHLGSTATMSTTGGGPVNGSTARYYPFGDWRTEPTANLTDRGFTGHMHNNLGSAPDDIGLVYMNARP